MQSLEKTWHAAAASAGTLEHVGAWRVGWQCPTLVGPSCPRLEADVGGLYRRRARLGGWGLAACVALSPAVSGLGFRGLEAGSRKSVGGAGTLAQEPLALAAPVWTVGSWIHRLCIVWAVGLGSPGYRLGRRTALPMGFIAQGFLAVAT